MLSKQEMFNRAYIGLKSQGFKQCVREDGECLYSNGSGMHCAWGWINPDTTLEEGDGLADYGNIDKIYAELDASGKDFARALQNLHDTNNNPKVMERALYRFAGLYNLNIPSTTTETTV